MPDIRPKVDPNPDVDPRANPNPTGPDLGGFNPKTPGGPPPLKLDPNKAGKLAETIAREMKAQPRPVVRAPLQAAGVDIESNFKGLDIADPTRFSPGDKTEAAAVAAAAAAEDELHPVVQREGAVRVTTAAQTRAAKAREQAGLGGLFVTDTAPAASAAPAPIPAGPATVMESENAPVTAEPVKAPEPTKEPSKTTKTKEPTGTPLDTTPAEHAAELKAQEEPEPEMPEPSGADSLINMSRDTDLLKVIVEAIRLYQLVIDKKVTPKQVFARLKEQALWDNASEEGKIGLRLILGFARGVDARNTKSDAQMEAAIETESLVALPSASARPSRTPLAGSSTSRSRPLSRQRHLSARLWRSRQKPRLNRSRRPLTR
jgi:hypothetical protein